MKLLFLFLLTASTAFAQGNYGPDRLFVKFKDAAALELFVQRAAHPDGDALFQEYAVDHLTKIGKSAKLRDLQLYVIHFKENENIPSAVGAFENTGWFEHVEPDYIGGISGCDQVQAAPNDDFYARQWALHNDGTFALSPATAGADMDMEQAWDIEQGDASVIVAIIDTGVKMNHLELASRIWHNPNETPGNGIDDDANGYVDDDRGWDFAYNDNLPADDRGHGTNVTGIIGAVSNNSFGYSGVDWHCTLMIIKGIDANDFGYYSWWADGLYYASDNGAKVVNMSLAGSTFSTLLQDAVNYARNNGALVVASMGNGNTNAPQYPAAYAAAFATGSTNADDTRTAPFFWDPASGSNYGNHIDVVAPGNYIYGLDYLSDFNFNAYWGGTSQASPQVSGLAALLIAQNPAVSVAQLRSIIQNTAEDQVGAPNEDVAGWDPYFGYGRVNAFAALSLNNPTGIQSASVESPLRLSPNPAQGMVLLHCQEPIRSVSVCNIAGQVVHEGLFEGGQKSLSLNVEGLPAGVYGVKVNGLFFEKLVVY